jgi:membrane-associated phospholipid phosphatase
MLKRYWREPRPYDPSVPEAVYGKYGMPSSHAQFAGFFVAYMTLFIVVRSGTAPAYIHTLCSDNTSHTLGMHA